MFRITHNTLRYFSFAEILVMVAINQLEGEQKIRGQVRRHRLGVTNDY
ncbi:MAG TPA: hypothetical protein VEH30_00480 [Terriglobales bacterium]|nr:hypothetical protein [Terriglobales bacterium]